MRDGNGIFIGNEMCHHRLGIDHVEERTCCGGRVSKYAYVICAKRGIVLAHVICVSGCQDRKYEKEGVSR